jgi:hypothetical protein
MKRALIVLLYGFVMLLAGYSFRAGAVATNAAIPEGTGPQGQGVGLFKVEDIAKLEWVDKHCRVWAPDGDIDVDQTCLV